MDLVDGLSNWYVRRSRSRFWAPATLAPQDKRDAYFTLYETRWSRWPASSPPSPPSSPRSSTRTWCAAPWPVTQPESVHLCAYPVSDAPPSSTSRARFGDGRAVRELVSLGLQVRTANKLKVRQPL